VLAADLDAGNVAFPSTMNDRITPHTERRHRERLAREHQIIDRSPVVCEPFRQWVIEDNFPMGRPQWERLGEVGLTLVRHAEDVHDYETMKLRLLNGSHLALSLLAHFLGYRYVHEAMADPLVKNYVNDFIHQVSPTVPRIKGVDLKSYGDSLVRRFSNPNIEDSLLRVTEDGHAKLLTTWRPTLVELAKHGQPSDTLGIAMAAWIRFTASETRAPTVSAPTVCAPTVGAHEPTLEAAAAALRLDSSHATVATFLRRYVGGDILINHESETPSGLVGRISDALMVMNHDDPEMMANAVRALLTSSQGWCSMAPL
jgi:mannitol-1-phosphate/altronate dehydrogenase